MEATRPISAERPLVLASSSARRRELLERVGLPLRVRPPSIEERALAAEPPRAAVQRLAHIKALSARRPGEWVLAADTVVLLDDEVMGKPSDLKEARAMLRRLSGREHEVITGFCLLDARGSEAGGAEVSTRVRFRCLSTAEVTAYVESGEPFGKAGAYAIQGVGAALVRELRGSYTNVVGLPLCEVIEALYQAGALADLPLASGIPVLEEGS